MSRGQAFWFAYQLPPALAGGSEFILIWSFSPIVSAKAGNHLKDRPRTKVRGN